jgi:hypothetical protein
MSMQSDPHANVFRILRSSNDIAILGKHARK